LNSTSFASLMEAAAMASATVDAGSAEAMMGRGLVVIVECAIWDRECSSESACRNNGPKKHGRPLRRGTARERESVQPRFALPLLVLRLYYQQRNHCTTLST
jgi:hypothetical protein